MRTQARKLAGIWLAVAALSLQAAQVPVIYCTDLFHPHVDPDDHFDLATLFALPELEVMAILLDQGDNQVKRPGSIPSRQMAELTCRQVPLAIGLSQKLDSPSDDGRAQPAEFQAAINLLIRTLRESAEPVTIIAAGSVRDLCAAWNREPALLKQKVGRLYLNIGSADPAKSEYNVDLDPQAYIGLLRSGLPIYLCCCLPMQRDGPTAPYSTWWRFRQAEVLAQAPLALQNFFIYALQRCAPEELDPLEALATDLRPWSRLVWEMDRNMWCTASFLHAAGRSLRRVDGSWVPAAGAAATGDSTAPFTFVPARIEVDQNARTTWDLNSAQPNAHLFKVVAAEDYGPAMRDSLRHLLRSFPPALLTHSQVFVSGQDGYNTYRIPGIETAPDGSLIAFAEARKYNAADPGFGQQEIDLVYKRSTDHGVTWSAMTVLEGSPKAEPPAPKVISRGASAETYQAFPDVCRLKNGDLFCVFYAGYGHVSLPRENCPQGGRICCVRSSDEGRTWSEPKVLFDGPFDDRDPHVAQMRDGTVVCTFFTYRPQPDKSARCDTSLVASRDGGVTWETEAQILAAEWPCSAPVRELPDGTRILGVYREDGSTAYGGIIRSTDGGKTWCGPIPIGKGSAVRLDAETDFMLLKDGILYAALRGDCVNMHFATSPDGGLTWSPVKDIGFPAHCPHFTRLSTGEILLAHRLPQTALHLSRDEAKTWQGPYAIDDRIGAYPSTIELKDATVLIVYYEEGENSGIRARRFRLTANGIEFLPL